MKIKDKEITKLFQNNCIIDITTFDANGPEDSLGYLCSGNIFVFKDGTIVANGDGMKECFNISDVIMYCDNLNNQDPLRCTSANFLLEDKNIEVTFGGSKIKQELTKTIQSITGRK